MGLLDDLYATERDAINAVPGTTRANYQKLKGLLGVDSTGNGLLSDLGFGARNAWSQAKWNAGNRLSNIQRYVTDPEYRNSPEAGKAIREAFEQYADAMAPGNMGGAMAGMIKVSHGSPHAFDRFSMDKIGTGEGAQAYGHGMYFGEGFDSPVAQQYRDELAGKEGLQSKIGGKLLGDLFDQISRKADKLPIEKAESEYEKLNFLQDLEQQPSFQHALDRIDDESIIPWAKSLESTYEPAGHLYNVELRWPDAAREAVDPLGPEHFIDYYKPLNEQPEGIKSILESAMPKGKIEAHGLDIGGGSTILDNRMGQADPNQSHPWVLKSGSSMFGLSQKDVDRMVGEMSNPTGENIYSRIAGAKGSQKEASNYLRELGIPGIRYLDQGSRGAGTGTHNYVVFDENIPNIVSRNGVSLSDLLRR